MQHVLSYLRSLSLNKGKAVVFRSPGNVSVEDVPLPEAGSDDVLVEITHSWISNGTEGSYLRGERIDGDTPILPGDPAPFPIISGYQKIGRIVWKGADIDDLEIGELVFCSVGRVEGMAEPRAGHLSPSVCSRGAVMKLPEGPLNPLAYAGLILTQVGYNCGWRPKVEPGDPAIVVGDGMVGQWAGQMLAYRGAEVTLIGRHPERLSLFSKGATLLEDDGDWMEVVASQYPAGIQVGVDTVGSLGVMDALQQRMCRYGHLVSAGFYGPDDTFKIQPARYREISIDLVSGATPDRLDETMKLIHQGALDTLSLITHHFPVDEAAAAWDLIQSKREHVLGVVLDWE